jgi:hypothetical protein
LLHSVSSGKRCDLVKHYILEGKTPVVVHDTLDWGKWFQTANRVVARNENDGVVVSTVFLGLDHRFGGKGPPLIFETMIFGGPRDQETYRYSTWEEAEAGHRKLLEEGVVW